MESTSRTASRKKTAATTSRAAKAESGPQMSPTHEAIAIDARRLFLESGSPPNRDQEFWLEAEGQLKQARKV